MSHGTSIPVPCVYDETVAAPMYVVLLPLVCELLNAVLFDSWCGIAIPLVSEGINCATFLTAPAYGAYSMLVLA